MENLVQIKNKKVLTSSLLIAASFEKRHDLVLKTIRNLECSEEFRLRNFEESSYQNSQGKTQPLFLITEAGFSFLAMGFTGKKAAQFKEKYIQAFDSMKETLTRQNNESWKEIRTHGKLARKELTDVIQDFVEYATAQGSTSAKFYYANITKMTYKALAMLEKGAKVTPGFRDLLDNSNLTFLAAAELKAEDALQFGMQEGMHYKEIYEYAKNKVEILAHAILPAYKRISA